MTGAAFLLALFPLTAGALAPAPQEASDATERTSAGARGESAHAQPMAREADLPPPIVGEVQLRLPAGTPSQGLSELIAVRRGAPLSLRDVRRSIERLYATGRFADIQAVASDAERGRVAVTFDLTPREYIDRVEFDGNSVLGAEPLRKALEFADRRSEYSPELLDSLAAKLRAAYRRVGYAGAEVTHALSTSEQGESVLTLQIREGGPTRIVALSVAGDPQLPIGEICDTLGLWQGSVLDLDRLDAGVKAVRDRFRALGYYRARVSPPDVRTVLGGAVVMLPVKAGPKTEFHFSGNRTFADDELRRTLAYDGEERLDASLLGQLAEKIADFYRLSAFADVRVRWREIRSADRRRSSVVFALDEGEPLRVVSVGFHGNRHFTAEFLRARLNESLLQVAAETGVVEPVSMAEASELGISGTEAARARLKHQVDPTAVYAESLYRQAIARMTELYRADGYLSSKVELWKVERDEVLRQAKVSMRIVEGVQTRVTELTFPGAPDARTLSSMVKLRPGSPLSFYEVESARMAVKRALGRQGYLFAKVTDEERISEDHLEASVALRVEPGPKVRIGKVLVEGNLRTRRDVVVSALALEENAVLDPDGLLQGQRNLVRLGIFKTAQIRMNAPEVVEEVKDLYVAVEERPTVNVVLGGGFSLIDGPRAFVEYGKVNLLGRALQLQARAKVNYFNASYPVLSDPKLEQQGFDSLGRRVNVGLQYPRLLSLLPYELGTRIDLIHERVNRPAYGFTRASLVVGADFVGTHGLTASLQYEVEADEVKRISTAIVPLSKTDIERLRFDEGVIYLHSLRPALSLDLRDDPANPRKGVLLSGSTELVQSLGGSVVGARGETDVPFSFFLKASVQANGYLPLGKKTVLALSARGGRVFPLDPGRRSRTIPPKRFFLGGAPTLRGFRDDGLVPEDSRELLRAQLRECEAALNRTGCTAVAEALSRGENVVSEGGELFTLARAELRFPLAGTLEGALFVDAGNLWLDQSRYQPLVLRYAAGAGLRVVTPIGPAALDLGVNADPDSVLNESRVAGHFSIGLF